MFLKYLSFQFVVYSLNINTRIDESLIKDTVELRSVCIYNICF